MSNVDLNFFQGKHVYYWVHEFQKKLALSSPAECRCDCYRILTARSNKSQPFFFGINRRPYELNHWGCTQPNQAWGRISYGCTGVRFSSEMNLMGTVNLLECVRAAQIPAQSVVIITTDKVYENRECTEDYRENDPLNGYDPYFNSKSCAELAAQTYQRSFFQNTNTVLSTVGAGNALVGYMEIVAKQGQLMANRQEGF